jgi:CubicO group peptidase (beta-lactamase class C family)
MDRLTTCRRAAAALLATLLAACGGGGDPGAPLPSDPERTAAATATAQSASNDCAAIHPFYWEVGHASARVASGSVGGSTYTATTTMNIASASKWLYAAHAVQQRNGVPTDSDIKFLTFRSGYTSFSICLPGHTVDSCLAFQDNGVYTAANDGRFFYNGGHMQKHASVSGLGALDNAGLANALHATLGSDIALAYSQPQPPGGVVTSADDYARFLRKLLRNELQLGALLGAHAVCTNPATCPGAVSTPISGSESWHYALGHWVEDDPAVGDGAFSSAGAFGFYPWIDAGRRYYGIVARRDSAGTGHESVRCGRLIRKAWLSGVAQ